MRIPFLRPKPDPEAAPAKPKRARPAKPAPVADVLDVQTARTQARRRLIGAVVLLAIGIIGFPILFETKPRPLPMDTPMEAVRREAAAGGVVVKESAPARTQAVAMPPADAGNEGAASSARGAAVVVPVPVTVPAPAAATAVPPVAAKPVITEAAEARAPAVPATAAVAAAPKAPAVKPAASAVPAGIPAKPAAESASGDAAPQRFVVQAGAYKEAGKLREARSKIEGLGYKTYTQVVENDNGSRTRVRVGPFPTREEAEAVVAKIKRNGLPAAIVKL